jgi:glutamyl-tRNA reductase
LSFLQIIAFTHRHFNFDEIGFFHLEDSNRVKELTKLKLLLDVDELMYISTCNRVEFIIKNSSKDTDRIASLIVNFFEEKSKNNFSKSLSNRAEVFLGDAAVRHLFCVASSLDSLVVGEREIITQVRKAFEECKSNNICGDFIRVLVQLTIQTAKKVYTESNIATRPVSVVSLAYLELKKYMGKTPKIFLIIGAGRTTASMLKFISKNNGHQYIFYNRSVEKAKLLVEQLNIDANVYPLSDLGIRKEEFDFIITCTGSKNIVLDQFKFNNINHQNNKATIVDLAVPKDCSDELIVQKNIRTITVDQLKIRAEENLAARSKEVSECLQIIDFQINEYKSLEKERELERKMSKVPQSIKGIRKKAFAEVFAKEIQSLDPDAREVLDSLVDYMEKKYISVPMKMAKEILLKESIK